MAEPIPYMTPEPRRRLKIPWRAVIPVALAVILVPAAILVEVRTDYGWICSICGSMRHETSWAGGLTMGESIERSPLDTWINQNQGGHSHDGRNIQGTGRNLFGGEIVRAHGSAPPILSISAMLGQYLGSASTEQIAAFVKVMGTGTDGQQSQAVKDAYDVIALAPRPRREPATSTTP